MQCIYKPISVKLASDILKYWKHYSVKKANKLIHYHKYFNIYIMLLNEYKECDAFINDAVYSDYSHYENPITQDEFDELFQKEKELQFTLNSCS